jgi:PmbA protein
VLTSWFLDSAAAKQLGLTTTGHAARGTGGPPSPAPTNLYLEAGSRSPEAMIKSLKQGLYVTDLIGMGVNGVTGDYSRGAAGFFIEDGALTYPVSEITVASNLKEMFATLEPASDLVFRYGVNAPTILIASMTIAGT